MLAEERRMQILKIVLKNKSVLVKDLCEMFNVTNETIRKDLIRLENEGKLLKTYGGAFIKEGVKNEIPIDIREGAFTDLKQSIGLTCSNLIDDGDVIILDCSTTSLQIAELILSKEELTILTNSIKIANVLLKNKSFKIFLAGGILDNLSLSFVGRHTEEFFNNYFVDKCFVSCRGLSMNAGITDSNEALGTIRKLMFERSRKKYVVADSSKFDLTNFSIIDKDFSLIDTIITDKLPNNEWKQFLTERKIEYIETLNK